MTTTLAAFDDSRIAWHRLGDFEHFFYNVLAVDEARQITDFVIRYEPNERIFVHRHRSETHTFVVAGEHRIYAPEGPLRELRPCGSYTASPADAEPHAEGGGASGAVVLYNTRGSAGGVLFEVLDDKLDVVATLGIADVAGLFEQQGRRAGG